jgi:DNA-binding SARP family transcriptional activator
MPALPDHFVPRPRVREILTDAIESSRVCFVAAAAGSGKTSALVEACRHGTRRVAWLTVDTPDRAPGRLLTYLEAAVSQCTRATWDVAMSALTGGTPHVEAAGLLAEALGDVPTVVVLDELERLQGSSEAWEVIDAFVRYAPEQATVVLSGRDDPPSALLSLLGPGAATYVDDAALAFTVEEATHALARSGRPNIDAPSLVASIGGWVAGVLFHQPDETAESTRRAHPLREYLAANVIGRLPEDLQEFVVTTSVLGQVSAKRAAVFGYADAGARLATLRSLHLPVVWKFGGQTLIWHTAIREYLLERLDERGVDEIRRVRRTHARLLASEGLHEEAVESYLLAGEVDECVESASKAIAPVIRRLDFGVAERWLSALSDSHAPGLTIGRLLIALARDDLSRAVAIVDRAREHGVTGHTTAESDRAGFLMIWCYLHHGRWKDAKEVLATMSPGLATDALRYALPALGDPQGDDHFPVAPAPLNGLAEVIINIGRYGRGQLTELTATSEFGWDMSLRLPWRIAALSALGNTQEALREYRAIEDASIGRVTLLTFVGPDLLIDAGAYAEAEQIVEEAVRFAGVSGSLIFQAMARLAKARLQLRVRDDPAAALNTLDAVELRRATTVFLRMSESEKMWRGLAYLKQGRDAEAFEILRTSVESMMRGDRILELPTAAAYLAEAAWRVGDELAADQAADLALDSARRQGSNHLLHKALDDVPMVLTRRLDAEATALSPWHDLGRARKANTNRGSTPTYTTIELREFGRRELIVGGDLVKMPIGKSYELLAYLLTQPQRPIHRDALLGVLFDDRQDASSRSYLRQSIRWLKVAMPEGVLDVNNETVTLVDDSQIRSEAGELTRRLAEASTQRGEERLARTLEAIATYEKGPYLPGVRSTWADARERVLTELVTDARAQIAVIATQTGRHDLAVSLAHKVLDEDPGRESAWQTLMLASEAVGDQDGIAAAFRECENALADFGLAPSPTTRGLLARLRR